MCIFLSLSLACSSVRVFLSGEPFVFEEKNKEKRDDDEFQMFVYSFAVLDFSSLCLCSGDRSVLYP